MPILLLIRHATNDFVKTGRLPGQTPNIHLNDEGRKQAEALGELLSKRPLDAVYSSQLERAIETAWRVAKPHQLPIAIRPALADINNGDFTGKEIKKLLEDEATKDLWKVVVETPSQAVFPNGEAMLDMQKRVVAGLEAVITAHPDIEVPSGEPAANDGRGPTDSGRQATQTGSPVASASTSPISLDPSKIAPGAHPSDSPAAGKAEDRKKDENQSEHPKPEPPKKRPQIVAVVAHADVIKAALAHYLDMPFDSFQKLGVQPASVSMLMVMMDDKSGKRHVMVNNINQVPYA